MAIEVFHATVGELYGSEAGDIGEIPMNEPGWYWWHVPEGTDHPDDEPHGPFETEADARRDVARRHP